jgi:carbon storage regulator CsrA
MLVLSRKKDEAIIMKIPGHEDIRLTVVRIDNMNKVRIGVEADKDVVVLRSELETPTPVLDNTAELRTIR